MVYGARLESVCTGNRTVGSNPTFTATQSLSAPDAEVTACSSDMDDNCTALTDG